MERRQFKDEIIILKKFGINENDLLINGFGRFSGKIQLKAKGSKKILSKFTGRLESLCIINAEIYFSSKSYTLTNATLKSDPILAPDLPSFELSQKICQIINQFLPFEEPNPKLFHLLEKSIEAIKTGTRYPKTEIYFLTKFLEFSGFLPSFNFCNQCHQKFDDNPYLNEDFEFYCSKCVPTNQSQEQNQINLSTLKLLNFITTCNRVDQLRPLKIPDQNQSEAKFILEKLVKHQLF